MVTKELIQLLKTFTCILLFLALMNLPYGYYNFLRIAVTATSVICLLNEQNDNNKFVLVIICILFNPIIPIHLSKTIWQPIDLGVGIYFLISAINHKNKLKSKTPEG